MFAYLLGVLDVPNRSTDKSLAFLPRQQHSAQKWRLLQTVGEGGERGGERGKERKRVAPASQRVSEERGETCSLLRPGERAVYQGLWGGT